MAAVLQPQGVGTLAYPLYKCLSTDERPRPSGEDATLYEIDTRRWYVWHAGNWYLFAEPGSSARLEELLGQLVSETRKIRSGLEHLCESAIPDPGE